SKSCLEILSTRDGRRPALDALIAAARAVHFFCALLMFGELVFALAIGPAARSLDARTARQDVSPRTLRILAWALPGASAPRSGLEVVSPRDGGRPALEALIAAARAVHFFGARRRLGELVFALAIGPPARPLDARTGRQDVSRRTLRILAWPLPGASHRRSCG